MHRIRRAARRPFAAALACGLMLAFTVDTAAAHDPIFVGDDQTTPDTGPYMPDGAISWALYGQVLETGDTRGFEFDLRSGDELYISLLIPNLDPELSLGDDQLPTLELEAPDGSTRTLVGDERTIFDEPFSRTSYVTLLELREPGQAGRYRGVVVGSAPSRFTVAIGEQEIFFTETERSGDRPENFAEITAPLQAWYATPPGGEATGEADDVGVDLDLVEEAMESGEGTIAEGVDEDAVMATGNDGEAENATEDTDTADTGEGSGVSGEPEPEPEGDADSDDGGELMTEDEANDEPGAADRPEAEPDGDESAAVESTSDGGNDDSGATWVAPVVIAAIALGGAGAFLVRRRTA